MAEDYLTPNKLAWDDRTPARTELDEWQRSDRPWRLAHSYTLQATKREATGVQ